MIKFRNYILVLFCIALTVINVALCLNMQKEHDGYFTLGTIFLYSPVANGLFLIIGAIVTVKLSRLSYNSAYFAFFYIALPVLYFFAVLWIGLQIGGGGC